jgi:hypothetical protein
MRSSTRHPSLATLILITGLCLLYHEANAREFPTVSLEVSLSESEYQANDPVTGEIRITTNDKIAGRVRLTVASDSTGQVIYRTGFNVHFREAGTQRFPFSIVPTPPPNDSYTVVATLKRNPKRSAQGTAEFSVHAELPPSPEPPSPEVAPLPFWLTYCADPTCGGQQPLVVHVCPEGNSSCSPTRQTTIVPNLDGRQISQILFPIQPTVATTGVIATVISGSGQVLGASLVLSLTSPVILKSDVDITFSYYSVAPMWGGTTHLDFVSTTMSSPEVVSTVYRHPTFLVNDEATQIHERGREIIAVESQIAGINPGQMHAIFMPSEFATLGEGNFATGDLNIYMNYGNPPFIEFIGSVVDAVMPRFAHEYVHELFSEVAASHSGNSLCLNEGLADAFAFAAGFLPEPDFGPNALRGGNFNEGCAEILQNFEVRDAGNCPFWQVHRLGLLSQSFVANILRPQRVIEFDSCDLTSDRTGNALIVLFSEASGIDMTEAIQMAEIPNAGSFEAAKQALGL